MTPDRRERLVRIVVEFLLAEIERRVAEQASVSGVVGTVSGHEEPLEEIQ